MRLIILLIIIINTSIVAAAASISCNGNLEVEIDSKGKASILYATCSGDYLILRVAVHNQTGCTKTAVINISNTIIRVPVYAKPSSGMCTYTIDTRGISLTRLNQGQKYTVSLGADTRIVVKAFEAAKTSTMTGLQKGNNETSENNLIPYTGGGYKTGAYTPGRAGEHKILKALLIISLLTSTALAAVKEYG